MLTPIDLVTVKCIDSVYSTVGFVNPLWPRR